MPATPLQLALFDCDGTLVDSQHSIISAMDKTCESHQLEPVSRDSVRRIVGLPLEVGMSHLFPGLNEDSYIDFSETYRHHFRQMRLADTVEEPLFPNTKETLQKIEQMGWLLGVATGKAMRGLIPTLDTHNMRDMFSTLQTADIALGKPNPDMVHKALNETGVDKKNAIVIGDTTYDILMAKNAGVKSIGVSWGYHEPEELLAAGASCVITEYTALPETLERVWEQDK